jgi:hypothetical protein
MFTPRLKRSHAGARNRRQLETPTRSRSTATRWSGSRSARARLRGTCAGSATAQLAQVRPLLSCGTTWRVASGWCTTALSPPMAGAPMTMPSARARSALYSTRSRAIALVVSADCRRISDGAEEFPAAPTANVAGSRLPGLAQVRSGLHTARSPLPCERRSPRREQSPARGEFVLQAVRVPLTLLTNRKSQHRTGRPRVPLRRHYSNPEIRLAIEDLHRHLPYAHVEGRKRP